MTSVTAHDSESRAGREAECVYHHHLPKQSLTRYDSTHPPPAHLAIILESTSTVINCTGTIFCQSADCLAIVYDTDRLGTVWQSFSTPIDYLGTVFSCCSSSKHSLH
ncbi:hypothetical protein PGT21_010933 [Puccinia graminis f. sp. tritici]|uniref:Uncharacterized protein n=1 Tax=Puccinia graminis f. sp. tritici TaxID=56615 RepID=A0A5B0QFP4_PUCGR|nr:hypothetical protein PGT21_010933 [Puccinia graminis f. sp. tritici]